MPSQVTVSTRLMGALIMTHSDDNGLVLPPHLAPIQVVIVPIYKNDEQLKQIDAKVEGIVAKLKALGISVKYDNADNKRPGFNAFTGNCFFFQCITAHHFHSVVFKMEYVWATSWGVSTRLMGALIMTHSDDNGLEIGRAHV